MGQRLCRSKFVGGKFAGRVSLVDARKDFALARKFELGMDPKTGKKLDIKLDSKVDELIYELKKTAGTPKGAALRREIVKVVSAAKKEVSSKACRPARGRW